MLLTAIRFPFRLCTHGAYKRNVIAAICMVSPSRPLSVPWFNGRNRSRPDPAPSRRMYTAPGTPY